MIRSIGFAALTVGLLLGIAFPRAAFGNLTGHTLGVALTPPTQASGSSVELSCGWHVACVSPFTEGYGLDWDDGGSYGSDWHFRGFFYVSNSNRTAFKMYPLVSVQNLDDCDVMTVWITEIHSGALMAIPTYTHVKITSGSSFQWTGGPWTVYHTKKIGTTIDDDGSNCPFTGSHVHEAHVDYLTDLVLIERHTALYPTAEECSLDRCSENDPPYGPYANNNINNWTNHWQWSEGAASH